MSAMHSHPYTPNHIHIPLIHSIICIRPSSTQSHPQPSSTQSYAYSPPTYSHPYTPSSPSTPHPLIQDEYVKFLQSKANTQSVSGTDALCTHNPSDIIQLVRRQVEIPRPYLTPERFLQVYYRTLTTSQRTLLPTTTQTYPLHFPLVDT